MIFLRHIRLSSSLSIVQIVFILVNATLFKQQPIYKFSTQNYIFPEKYFNTKMAKRDLNAVKTSIHENIPSFQQQTLRYLIQKTGSRENAMKHIDEKIKEAEELLDKCQRTCKGIYRYLTLIKYIRVHDQ